MRNTLVIYYESKADQQAARVAAEAERRDGGNAFIRDATAFRRTDPEPCDRLVIMPDVKPRYRALIEAVYCARYGSEWQGFHSPPLLTPERVVEGMRYGTHKVVVTDREGR